ncbi:MAG: manganese efflux pump MntP family protein [Candidatus Omnitrophica bacterium]|nr:manganese efflux pump MntP family protein [Candidatus Omnitrophota bacterium]
MAFTEILLIAVGLSLDAFAISLASGVIIQRRKIRKAFVYGAMFGGFQMLMPLLGFSAGINFRDAIAAFDHWIAFALLFFIGAKMIYEAFRMEDIERVSADVSGVVLVGLAVATSVDALAVGISFAFLNVAIFMPVVLIGVVTFLLSFAGVLVGSKCGRLFENKIEIVGGLVLVGMGVKILWEHLRAG